MEDTRRNLLVGLFMVGGLAVLGALMIVFGEQPSWLGGTEYELKMNFRELEGVSEGMEIRLNGVQVGRVGRLEFDDRRRPDLGVQVIGLIKDRFYIPSGAHAEVFPGLLGLGRGHIEIVPPAIETEPLDRTVASNTGITGEIGNPFQGLVPETLLGSVEKAVVQIGTLADRAAPVADDLHDLFQKRTVEEVDRAAESPIEGAEKMTATLYTVVERSDSTLKHFNEVLGDPQVKSALREAIENFRQISEDGVVVSANLRETSEHIKEDWDRLAGQVESGLADANTGINEIRQKIGPILDGISSMVTNLDRVSRDLAEGEGTAGLILRDARLYEELLLSVQRFTDTLDTIRRMVERFEKQGYIDIRGHKVVGPLSADTKIEIPPKQ